MNNFITKRFCFGNNMKLARLLLSGEIINGRQFSLFVTPVEEDKRLLREKRKVKLHKCFHRSSTFFQENDNNFEVTSEDLDADDDNLLLIDVRGPDEIESSGKIPGAVNLPMDELEFALNLSEDIFEKRYGFDKPPDDGTNVIFYCRAGIRSLHSLGIAKNLGLEKAKHLSGGYLAWQEHEQTKN